MGAYPWPSVLAFYSNSTIDISQLPDSNCLSDTKPAGKVPDPKVRVGHALPQTKLGINRPVSPGTFSEKFEMH